MSGHLLELIMVAALGWAGYSFALDDSVVALSQFDATAVVRSSDGEMRAVKVGDELDAGRYEVQRVLPDRLVLLERARDGRPQLTVWMYLADANGVSRVQRLEPTPPAPAPKEDVEK